MGKSKRKVPGLNASSTADISFILLIFFLVVTSMNSNFGMQVMLPNPPEDQNQDDPEVHERNLMKVYVNMDNEILVTPGKESAIPLKVEELDQLRELAKEFITANTGNGVVNDKFPERKAKLDTVVYKNDEGVDVVFPNGQNVFQNNKHVITLQTDRSTKYEVYFKVQEALYGAYNDLRDEFAKEVYGVQNPEKELTADEFELCRRRYVNMISEAQPIDIGKKR